MTEFLDDFSERRPTAVTLSEPDGAVVDALLGVHEAIAPSARLRRAQGWLSIVAAAPAPLAPADLGERTLTRLHAERMKSVPAASGLGSGASPGRPYRSRHLRDFAAMAVAAGVLGAVVMLGVAQARQSARRVACASNLMNLTTAFATYASTNHDQLPALAMAQDRNWLTPNPARAGSHTNSENLLLLINAGLIRPVSFICPGRPRGSAGRDLARGYSYVNMFAKSAPAWDRRHETIVLGDRNPLFDPAATIDAQSNSANHGRHGNYVVRADGTVTWETSPNVGVGGDNIWTIGSGPQYQTAFAGTETPASVEDTFLSP